MESDVETVRAREEKDQKLLDSGGVSPKEMTNLQHELETLKRRQSDLEDQELELMERLEVGRGDPGRRPGRAGEGAGRPGAGPAAARRRAGRHRRRHHPPRGRPQRDRRGMPAPLLALYERIRTQTGGTGAAMLKARQCQGCRLELYGNELSAVRNADPHEVVRCENCGRILVRTAESGL